jgi:predicted MPP superfamily phosphohydrolase
VLLLLIVTHENVVTSVVPLTKHESELVHLSFLFLKSNMRGNELIFNLRNDLVPSLVDAESNSL